MLFSGTKFIVFVLVYKYVNFLWLQRVAKTLEGVKNRSDE
jgi:hypothetical protein